jgi:hypothetical protein
MDIKAKTKHGELTLDEIGSLMPGMSEPMAAIGQRYQTTSHAAPDGNWLLAAYQLRAIRKLFGTSKRTRPKYAQAMDEFADRHLAPFARAIEAKDWAAFSTASEATVATSDEYQRTWGYGYILYRVSHDPGAQYRLVPPTQA